MKQSQINSLVLICPSVSISFINQKVSFSINWYFGSLGTNSQEPSKSQLCELKTIISRIMILTKEGFCIFYQFQRYNYVVILQLKKAKISKIRAIICFLYFCYIFIFLDFIHYNISFNLKMGNNCCQDVSHERGQIVILEDKVATGSTNGQFYQTSIPDDPVIISKLTKLKEKQTYSFVIESQKPQKHKYTDKYYIGKWNSEGKPEGLGIMFEPGSYFYYGQFKQVPHGKGTLQLLQLDIVYDGNLNRGKAEGQGSFWTSDRKIQFEGLMENSYPKSGELKINNHHDSHKSFTIRLDNFPNLPVTITYGDGRVYKGNVNEKTFAPTGTGLVTFSDNSSYEGQWLDGYMHGFGKFSWSDGTSYTGQYNYGRKHGKGTFVFLGGKFYEGLWQNGRQNGFGILRNNKNQTIQQGIWKQGVFQKSSS